MAGLAPDDETGASSNYLVVEPDALAHEPDHREQDPSLPFDQRPGSDPATPPPRQSRHEPSHDLRAPDTRTIQPVPYLVSNFAVTSAAQGNKRADRARYSSLPVI